MTAYLVLHRFSFYNLIVTIMREDDINSNFLSRRKHAMSLKIQRENHYVLPNTNKCILLSLTSIVGSIMNLINEIHHLCERRKYTFICFGNTNNHSIQGSGHPIFILKVIKVHLNFVSKLFNVEYTLACLNIYIYILRVN